MVHNAPPSIHHLLTAVDTQFCEAFIEFYMKVTMNGRKVVTYTCFMQNNGPAKYLIGGY